MPIRSYQCPNCSHALTDVFEWGLEPPRHECLSCSALMYIVPSSVSCGPSTGDTKEYRDRKSRFERRNKRFMEMPEKTQEGFKKLIDKTGGQRYIP